MKNVLIIGLGLLGGSYAKGLTEKGYRVSAIDPQESSIAFGIAENMIAEGATTPSEDLVASADLVVFALYPQLMLDWVRHYQKWFMSGAVITDLCGVKVNIVTGMEEILREDVYFVGSHPMAGREVSGVEYADPTMFHKANFIITPTAKSSEIAIKTVETMANDLGFKQISHLSPLEHDKAIGFLSQLTHVIAVTLMNAQESDSYVKYTGDSFRDLTRIAMINEDLWSQLFLENKTVLLEEMNRFSKELDMFKEILEKEDLDGMKDKFITSTERRKKYVPPLPQG